MKAFPRYVVFGEALTDMIRGEDGRWLAVPGGSCWNVARVGARLGVPTAFAGAVSGDLFGDELWRESQAAGLDMRFMQQLDRLPLLAMVASSHPPRYFFVGADSADLHFDSSRLPPGWRDAVEVAHFGGISLAREPLAGRLVAEAHALARAHKAVAYDPNFRPFMNHRAYREVFTSMASIARFIKVSDEDLQGLFQHQTEQQALQSLRALAPSAEILFTQGAKGMTLFAGQHRTFQAAFPVDVVDTVGCGDAAMGAWIATGLMDAQRPVTERLRLVAASASLAATRAGPYAAPLPDVMEFVQRH